MIEKEDLSPPGGIDSKNTEKTFALLEAIWLPYKLLSSTAPLGGHKNDDSPEGRGK